jgi:hypothetical protein
MLVNSNDEKSQLMYVGAVYVVPPEADVAINGCL